MSFILPRLKRSKEIYSCTVLQNYHLAQTTHKPQFTGKVQGELHDSREGAEGAYSVKLQVILTTHQTTRDVIQLNCD